MLLSNNLQFDGINLPVKTINAFSGIGLCKGPSESIVNNVLFNKYSLKRWRQLKVLIIDEISMMSCKTLNVLESIARLSKKNNIPFGGIQLILLGDFLQLPPIPDTSDPETAKFCFESEIWYNLISLENHIQLKTIFRQTDEIFRNILNEIRIGELSDENNEILKGYVGRQYNPKENNNIIPIEILSTRNEVSNTNERQYNQILGDEKIFVSRAFSSKHIPPEILEREIKNLKNNMPVEDTIKLKIGAPVMVLVNIDLDDGICNGSLGIVSKFSNGFPMIIFNNGIQRSMGLHTWTSHDYPALSISQVPLTLAFASSIHKQQGSSIQMARMNLGNSIFENSQIYVALSRVTSLDGLYLDSFHASKISVNKKAKEFYETFPVVDYATLCQQCRSTFPENAF